MFIYFCFANPAKMSICCICDYPHDDIGDTPTPIYIKTMVWDPIAPSMTNRRVILKGFVGKDDGLPYICYNEQDFMFIPLSELTLLERVYSKETFKFAFLCYGIYCKSCFKRSASLKKNLKNNDDIDWELFQDYRTFRPEVSSDTNSVDSDPEPNQV